jgi:hypothetical protein
MSPSGNLQTQYRTSTSVYLGRTRHTIGSITRKYNYCARNSSNPLQCTFNMYNFRNSNTISELDTYINEFNSLYIDFKNTFDMLMIKYSI